MRREHQPYEHPVATATYRVFSFSVCIYANKCTFVSCLVDVVRGAKYRSAEAVMLDRVATCEVCKLQFKFPLKGELPCLTSWLRSMPVMPFSSHQRLVTSGPNPKPTPNFIQYQSQHFDDLRAYLAC
jgi:hypothetical protein